MQQKMTLFGNVQNFGVIGVEAQAHDQPGLVVFGTIDTDTTTKMYTAMWVDSTGDVRVADFTTRIVQGVVDLTLFDQDADGTVIGGQS